MPDVRVIQGDCLDVLPALGAGSFDAVVTDAPYGLEFMGKEWDAFKDSGTSRLLHSPKDEGREFTNASGHMWDNTKSLPRFPRAGRAFGAWCQQWAAAALRALKPGGYMLCFGGTRTYHRLACAVEDAGFEVRDCLMWLYGSGFPKGKGCLKPAWEPILLARRPGPKVLPLGIDECRVPAGGPTERPPLSTNKHEGYRRPWNADPEARAACEARREEAHDKRDAIGRYPAHVVHDGSPEVLEAFAAFGEKTSGSGTAFRRTVGGFAREMEGRTDRPAVVPDSPGYYGDSGTAARFFYCAKASKADRGQGNTHPTVKPTALLRWLVKLVCPPGGLVLDPFAGSGTTGVACLREGRSAVLIEREPAYVEIIHRRLQAERDTCPLFTGQGGV
jgi:DNA modification methylase